LGWLRELRGRGALKLFELVKKGDLEGLVVKRKDGKYTHQNALVQNPKSRLTLYHRSHDLPAFYLSYLILPSR